MGLLMSLSTTQAQQINLDKPVKAGELTLFPALGDESKYYYIADKPRLATDENGRPKFSFLRYVENVRSTGDENIREGVGGGIVHAVVVLKITPEQLSDAKRELQRKVSGASIEGPVMYRSGKFTLISSFTNTDGELTEQVVGMGTAPLLDDQNAAISMQLTKLGAKILWESFQTTTPDISFSFEMDLAGFREPHRAVIEADFDQIYEHKSFNAAIASTHLSGEIKQTYDDLMKKGAIKLTQVGDDEDLDKLITTAYNKLADMMFSPVGGTGTPSLGDLTKQSAGGGSLLDKASKHLQDARKEARDINKDARDYNLNRAKVIAEAENGGQTPAGNNGRPQGNQNDGTILASNDQEYIPFAYRQFNITPPGRQRGQSRVEAALPKAEEVDIPSFSVMAVYEMKKVRQRGIFKIDLNKYTTDMVSMRFDENIGNLSRYLNDNNMFRQVNLDDPLYRQREIVAMVDGFNAEDFGKYINFVNVRMEKKHQNGKVTQDEVRIDRNNFNREGNYFKMLYGWNGDTKKQEWFDYDYALEWSFFGGYSVTQPLQSTNFSSISLTPPYQRRFIDLQAEPSVLRKGVRSITVNLYSQLGGKEFTRQVTLIPSRDELSKQVELLVPAGELEFEYEVSMRMRGNKVVKSNRVKSTESLLFVDELPR